MKILKLLLFKEDDNPMRIHWGVLTDCWCGYKAKHGFLGVDHNGTVSRSLYRSHLVRNHAHDPYPKRVE